MIIFIGSCLIQSLHMTPEYDVVFVQMFYSIKLKTPQNTLFYEMPFVE